MEFNVEVIVFERIWFFIATIYFNIYRLNVDLYIRNFLSPDYSFRYDYDPWKWNDW